MPRTVLLLGLTGLLLGCVTPIQERPWLEARSEHFTIYSALPREATESLAVDLEIFRAAVGIFTNVPSTASPIPIEIFVFEKSRDLRRFGAGPNVGGFVRPSPRSYQILLAGSDYMSERVVLYHEYVHFLVRNGGGRLLPRWYDEGFADFLATAERDEVGLLIGKAHPVRATWLVHGRQMSVEQLIEPGILADLDTVETLRFYAWSWLLVHYLSWDYRDPQGIGFERRMRRYLTEIARGAEPAEALELAWSLTPDELDDLLKQAVRSGVVMGSLPLERLDYSQEVTMREVEAGEMARRLGAVALSDDPDFARSLFEAALLADPSDPRATAGLADSYKFAGQLAEAEPLFERAVELDPDDVLNLLDRAEYWLDRAAAARDEESRNALATRALEGVRRARALAPDSPEALLACGMGQMLLIPPDLDEALRALERAHDLLPSDHLILSTLLGAYASAGRVAEARRVGRWLATRAHSKDDLEAIEALLESASQAPAGAVGSPPSDDGASGWVSCGSSASEPPN